MGNSKIDTPFEKGTMGSPSKQGPGGAMNHHTTPALSKPRDGGSALPTQFFSPLKGSPAKIDSPFADAKGIHKKG